MPLPGIGVSSQWARWGRDGKEEEDGDQQLARHRSAGKWFPGCGTAGTPDTEPLPYPGSLRGRVLHRFCRARLGALRKPLMGEFSKESGEEQCEHADAELAANLCGGV